MKRCWLLFALAVLFAAAKSEAAIVSVISSGGNTFDDFSTPGFLAVDPSFSTFEPLVLSVLLEAGDVAPLSFNSIVSNLTGLDWRGYTLTLSGGAAWEFVGTIDVGPFGSLLSVVPPQGVVDPPSTVVNLAFGFEPDGFELGDPFAEGGDNWRIALGSLGVGDSFTLTLQPTGTPEPSSMAIVAGLFGLAGFKRWRRGENVIG